ncbi:MAG: EAL domain-containing protein, partial [Chromatiaceae bacterium]|nr:EAL domain-containing protein [Chromatiaceae bacterium]
LGEGARRLCEVEHLAQLGSWSLDLASGYLDWSPEVFRIFEMAPEDFAHDYAGFLDAVHPEDRARVDRVYRDALERREPYAITHRLLGADGGVKWVQERCETQYDAQGRALRSHGTVQDVTARVLAEQALRASEARYRALVEDAPMLICAFRPGGRIRYANRACCDYFGIAPDQASGANMLELIAPEDRAGMLAILTTLSPEAPTRAYEHRVDLGEGERWLYWTNRALFDEESRLLGYQSIGEDITERKREQSLLALQARRSEALLELPHSAEAFDEVSFLRYGQELAEDLTESSIGFIHFVDEEEQDIQFVAWSRRTIDEGGCQALQNRHYPIDEAGIWADAVRLRAPVTVNDYAAHAAHQGLPEGHLDLVRFISVPVIEQGRVVMLASVGNKARDYDPVDVETVQLIGSEIWRLVQRQRTLERLRLADRVFHDTAEGVAVTDADGRIVSVNPAFERITGYRADEVIGQNPSLLQSGRHDADFYRRLWMTVHEVGYWRGEIWNRRRDGEIYPEWLTISAVRDGRGQMTHYVGVFSDISHIKEAQQQIDFLAHHDALTRLPNRVLFQDRLEHALEQAKRNGRLLALLFIDLDRFKVVNDTFGHPVGDELLLVVSQRMQQVLRAGDTLARLGGDEFVLLIEDLSETPYAGLVAHKLLRVAEQPLSVCGHDLRVTASIGISLYPRDGADVDTLVRHADRAMYEAKQQGRNNAQFFNTALNDGALERLMLEHGLRGALERDELVLHYQPQVSLPQGRLLGVEALVRWRHPTLGLLAPARFVPLAEEIGLIGEIGRWVLEAACHQLAAWDALGFRVERVAVNLSVQQLEREGLERQVIEAIGASGIAASRLELEVTESMLMRKPDASRALLGALKSLGCALAVDDFGTGYSNLLWLKLLPLDRLKIDQSFVRDIGEDGNDEAIVRAVIAIAHSLGLETLAEGVEQGHQASFLAGLGVNAAQGYLYSRPLEPEALRLAWSEAPSSGFGNKACSVGIRGNF